ncbi:hypothetical protein PHMEG_00031470 [Phytophthora megakarya]|uniref:Reverse transcriptase/retrotransposon-derived protein RNase H-like domain-containing protein n=1 Tax=Phytophthora megakarya TaxID=4795 RepID=A0A225UY92_9STRA|nr:hypothetical protein PHMEG_00031470 [Phytophthora megakarya]
MLTTTRVLIYPNVSLPFRLVTDASKTGYAVAEAVKEHTEQNVAAFFMKQVVLQFGPFRELLMEELLIWLAKL